MSWLSHNPEALDTYIEAYLVENGFQKEIGEGNFLTATEALEYYCPDEWTKLLGEFEQYYFESRYVL